MAFLSSRCSSCVSADAPLHARVDRRPASVAGRTPMTMTFNAKDGSMVRQIHEGDKVNVRVENVNGTLTIVTLEKQS